MVCYNSRAMTRLHSTILASVGGILATAGFFWPGFGWLASVGGALALCSLAWSLGGLAFPGDRPSLRLAFGLLGGFALLSAFGAAVYYAYKLDGWAIGGLLALLPWLVFAFSPLAPKEDMKAERELLPATRAKPTDGVSAGLVLLFLLSEAAALRWLFGAATDEAIRTPWTLVHPIWFLWLFLGAVLALALSWRARYPHFALAALAIHLFVTLSPALVVYKLGYGFDPFIHAATEEVIAADGVITPKTPYYIGQYALVVILTKVTGAPVGLVDRLLVPVAAAIFLPLLAAHLARRAFRLEHRTALLASATVLFLPIAGFAATTPQSLADLFTLSAALLGASWLFRHRPPLVFVLLLVAAALATHPLSGVPAAAFAGFLMFFKLKERRHWSAKPVMAAVFIALFALAALALPQMLALNAKRQGAEATALSALRRPVPELLTSLPLDAPSFASRYRPALDFAQLVVANRAWLVVLAAVAGALAIRGAHYRRAVWASAGAFLAMLVAVAALRGGLTYAGVIDYEQQNYGNRLFDTALLLLAPLAVAGLARLWRALSETDAAVRAFVALFIAAAATGLAYGLFPRNDDYVFDRGWSVSRHDFAAAASIDERASGSYVVLSNQATAAAALRAYGFRAYYGDQFYYSIPTGAPLYRYYLDMVYGDPSRETMRAAAASVGVRTAYFAISDYWDRSAKIVEKAKTTADEWWAVDDGRVHVFRYSF